MSKTVFITGATAGFGEAMAYKFAEGKCRLILNGRREDRLENLKSQLEEKYNTEILLLPFDVRERDTVEKVIASIPEEWSEIDVLINNAGLAVGLSTVQDGLFDDWDRMLDTNVKGLLNVTKFVAPLMISKNKGHIINIGSIAGKEVYPNGNVYCASKHAVDALTKAMRIDMVQHNIKVSQIAPGAADTEFSLVRFKGDHDRADNVYNGFEPLQAEDIADVAWYIANLPPHVNINDLVLMPTAQASATVFNKKL